MPHAEMRAAFLRLPTSAGMPENEVMNVEDNYTCIRITIRITDILITVRIIDILITNKKRDPGAHAKLLIHPFLKKNDICNSRKYMFTWRQMQQEPNVTLLNLRG